MHRYINGIQQIGIGVANASEAFEWYKEHFGFDTIVFEDVAAASLMTRYTGGEVHQRYAVLAMNMQGGGGFEIWQYKSRKPAAPLQSYMLGDTGVIAVKLRCRDIRKAYTYLHRKGVTLLTSIILHPAGFLHFYVQDPFKNIFEIAEGEYWFRKNSSLIGGVCGIVVGVRSIEKAVHFYQQVLGYNMLVADNKGVFDDWKGLPGSEQILRRVLLRHRENYCGPFSRLLGPTTIELVQSPKRLPQKIYEGRFWGDLGFIHVCYDVCNMQEHSKICNNADQPLTVNSENSFSMGKAAGHFAYNEDPDGTLIEFVETHKVPIIKKLGWYLDLRKRNTVKPLPDWMVRCMGLGKKSLQLTSS